MVPLYTPLGPMMLTEPPGLRVTQSCLAIGKFPIAMILMSMIQYVIRYSWIPGFKGKNVGFLNELQYVGNMLQYLQQ